MVECCEECFQHTKNPDIERLQEPSEFGRHDKRPQSVSQTQLHEPFVEVTRGTVKAQDDSGIRRFRLAHCPDDRDDLSEDAVRDPTGLPTLQQHVRRRLRVQPFHVPGFENPF